MQRYPDSMLRYLGGTPIQLEHLCYVSRQLGNMSRHIVDVPRHIYSMPKHLGSMSRQLEQLGDGVPR